MSELPTDQVIANLIEYRTTHPAMYVGTVSVGAVRRFVFGCPAKTQSDVYDALFASAAGVWVPDVVREFGTDVAAAQRWLEGKETESDREKYQVANLRVRPADGLCRAEPARVDARRARTAV